MIDFSDLKLNQKANTNCDAKDYEGGDQEWPCTVMGTYQSEYGEKYNVLLLKNDQNGCRCRRRNDEMEIREGYIHFLQNSFNARVATVKNLKGVDFNKKPERLRF
jgi:hypothetical protein